MTLIINELLVVQMTNHCGSGYPEEVCGLLLGRHDEQGRARRVEAVWAAKNLDRSRARERYQLDPEVI